MLSDDVLQLVDAQLSQSVSEYAIPLTTQCKWVENSRSSAPASPDWCGTRITRRAYRRLREL